MNKSKRFFTRGPRTGRAPGARASSRVPVAMDGTRLLCQPRATKMGLPDAYKELAHRQFGTRAQQQHRQEPECADEGRYRIGLRRRQRFVSLDKQMLQGLLGSLDLVKISRDHLRTIGKHAGFDLLEQCTVAGRQLRQGFLPSSPWPPQCRSTPLPQAPGDWRADRRSWSALAVRPSGRRALHVHHSIGIARSKSVTVSHPATAWPVRPAA